MTMTFAPKHMALQNGYFFAMGYGFELWQVVVQKQVCQLKIVLLVMLQYI